MSRRGVVAIVGGLVALGAIAGIGLSLGAPRSWAPSAGPSATAVGASEIGPLFADHRSDVEVQGSGTVARLLPDDDDGARHQRFILRLSDGITVLVAHNIDIAPRLDGLSTGDAVEFRGEYIWSDKGGTVHWTHRDPSGAHDAGWLRWQGRTYD